MYGISLNKSEYLKNIGCRYHLTYLRYQYLSSLKEFSKYKIHIQVKYLCVYVYFEVMTEFKSIYFNSAFFGVPKDTAFV